MTKGFLSPCGPQNVKEKPEGTHSSDQFNQPFHLEFFPHIIFKTNCVIVPWLCGLKHLLKQGLYETSVYFKNLKKLQIQVMWTQTLDEILKRNMIAVYDLLIMNRRSSTALGL